MVPSDLVVELSRWQFAATALYHFMFVPLTLGLSFILVAMETVYVVTGRQIYKDMTMFWGKLFAINFALGVATGLTMEFEFGTNWSTYSYYVGDIFGAPLAVEGLMAFFMESTFVGMMLLGWHRLNKVQHLTVTWLVALGSNLSALWILVANGFMQDPQGSVFNPFTQRMELTSFMQLIMNPDAQAKFVHTSLAGYVTGAMFVVGISAWYLARKRHIELARRSLRMASLFGVISVVGVITLGDALGFIDGGKQPTKLAAMEGLWKTEKAPAPFNLIAFPNQEAQKNDFAIQIPGLLSILVKHDFTSSVTGIDQLEQEAVSRIKNGIPALKALESIQQQLSQNPDLANANARKNDPTLQQSLAQFDAHKKDLGYAYLLKYYAPDVSKATPAQIELAAKKSIPEVWIVFWAFRIMVALGFLMLFFLIWGTLLSLRGQERNSPMFLRLAPWMIPAGFLACEFGWITAEMGRQPWTVYETLPTWLSASTHSVSYMAFSLIGFVSLYSIFIVVEMYLMFKFARKGPDEHGTGGGSLAGEPAFARPVQTLNRD
ncbi:MAG: cytochrome ubiquinol oxidase subunit I [Acidihalobacter sp.]|uniref:cytochrome ubiquinol oxidase subunit I n=1 Tax=Acidihalobacter sp. TaxID=1872108 RepID=UPI00307CC843